MALQVTIVASNCDGTHRCWGAQAEAWDTNPDGAHCARTGTVGRAEDQGGPERCERVSE